MLGLTSACTAGPDLHPAALQVLHEIENVVVTAPLVVVVSHFDMPAGPGALVDERPAWRRHCAVHVLREGSASSILSDVSSDAGRWQRMELVPADGREPDEIAGTPLPFGMEEFINPNDLLHFQEPGWVLLQFLHPWGLSNVLKEHAEKEAWVFTNVLSFKMVSARLGHDDEGRTLRCRFRIVHDGLGAGPYRGLTGTADHKIWYDPATFRIRKRVVSGEYRVEDGDLKSLNPLTEEFEYRSSGARRN